MLSLYLYYITLLDKFDMEQTILHCTSSTAQGGGGSFKHRKAIGEVGCPESWMAERTQ